MPNSFLALFGSLRHTLASLRARGFCERDTFSSANCQRGLSLPSQIWLIDDNYAADGRGRSGYPHWTSTDGRCIIPNARRAGAEKMIEFEPYGNLLGSNELQRQEFCAAGATLPKPEFWSRLAFETALFCTHVYRPRRHHPGQHGGDQDIKQRAYEQRTEDTKRQITIGIDDFLRGGETASESDVRKKITAAPLISPSIPSAQTDSSSQA